MDLPNKIALRICSKQQCGLGDLLRWYHRSGHILGHLKSFKEKYPDIQIRLMLSCHNPQGRELLKTLPYIEGVTHVPWARKSLLAKCPVEPGWTLDNKRIRQEIMSCKYEKPEIYLTEHDEKIVKKIVRAGPFVVIHPFAGEQSRMPMPIREYRRLVDKLTKDLKLNSVVVGGTYTRGARLQKLGPLKRVERFDYNRNGMFNLVGTANVRVVTELLRRSVGYIGCWSCFACVAWEEKKPAVLYVTSTAKRILEGRSFRGRWHKDCRGFAITTRVKNKTVIDQTIGFYRNIKHK